MVDYVRMAETAERLIHKNGRAVTIVKLDQGSDDATKPWRGTTAPRDEPEETVEAIAAFVPISSASVLGFEAYSPDGSDSRRENQVALVASNDAEGLDLNQFDEIHDGDVIWRIVKTKELRPATTSVLFAFEVKQ